MILLPAAVVCALLNSDIAEARRSVAPQTAAQTQRAPGPLLVLVSIRKQRLRVFDNNGQITESRVSSGKPGFDTPTGVFSILEKHVVHSSNIYEGASMPFMQRITWSGIALHAGIVPGYRASHGCVRLPINFSKQLFDITKVGNRVVVSQDEAEPVAFEHPALFKPLPAEVPQSTGSLAIEDRKLAVNDKDPSKSDEVQRLMTLPDAPVEPEGPRRPRSRAEADKMTNGRILELQAAMAEAETQRTEAGHRAKVAMRGAEEAALRLKAERAVVDRFRVAAETAEKSRTEAIQAYETYMEAPENFATNANAQLAEDRETELENRILDLTIETDTARSEFKRRESELPDVNAITAAAEAERAAALDDAKTAVARLRSLETALINAKKDITRQNRILAVFISLKAQRIYIRQGFEPVIEAPISISGSPGKIGSHVFTAMDYAPGGNDLMWKLVTAQAPQGAFEDEDTSRRKRRDERASISNPSLRAVRTALDAIHVPDDIRQTISERIRPGASLIISDRELSGETGDGTEFVLLTR
jgi:hypothetical protein